MNILPRVSNWRHLTVLSRYVCVLSLSTTEKNQLLFFPRTSQYLFWPLHHELPATAVDKGVQRPRRRLLQLPRLWHLVRVQPRLLEHRGRLCPIGLLAQAGMDKKIQGVTSMFLNSFNNFLTFLSCTFTLFLNLWFSSERKRERENGKSEGAREKVGERLTFTRLRIFSSVKYF